MLIVLVPDFEALLREAEIVPSLIARMLARAKPQALDPLTAQSVLACGQAIAPAALSRLADCPDDSEGFWMRADPLSLQPDLNAVWLQSSAALSEKARDELVACFADEGLVLDFPSPERGYLLLDADPDCRFRPPWALAGSSLDQVLPEGQQADHWRRLLNESQVILHQHRAAGEGRAAGSLWFWGPGALPDPGALSARISHLVGVSPELIGLARLLKLSHEPAVNTGGAADGSLVLWTCRQDWTAAQNLDHLADWMAGIWRRLGSFRLDSLELASRSQRWVLRPRDRWKVWRVRRGAWT